MNTTLRRLDRSVSPEEAIKLLDNSHYGFLALNSDDEFPYAIPISFVRSGNSLYMHSAQVGRKIDCIRKSNKATFCVVQDAILIPEKFSTAYKSTMIFGVVNFVENENEKKCALRSLIEKFSPNHIDAGFQYVERSAYKTTVLKFDILGISGKARKLS